MVYSMSASLRFSLGALEPRRSSGGLQMGGRCSGVQTGQQMDEMGAGVHRGMLKGRLGQGGNLPSLGVNRGSMRKSN